VRWTLGVAQGGSAEGVTYLWSVEPGEAALIVEAIEGIAKQPIIRPLK
jgi:hypothetical protein